LRKSAEYVVCLRVSVLGGLNAGEAFTDVSMVTKEARKVEYGTATPSYL
jgi:hypothetical protein